ncbi:MAG: hypothetical protein FWF38_02465 [Spirochaetaceae bacterium]|nr:hypothetical protein [Spirochaetaceae bacterium]
MKKLFCILLLFISYIIYGENPLPDPKWISSTIASDIEYLKKLYPCENNSRQEKAVYQFIRERLDSLSISYTEQPVDTIRGTHSFTSNIIVDFFGATNNTIIFAIPVNNLKDNSFNIAMALKLCEFFRENLSEKSVKILFLGSESLPYLLDTNYLLYNQNLVEKIATESSEEQLGSRAFLQDYFPESNVCLIYLNIENYENIVEISNITATGQTPLWFIKKASREMERNNINFFIDIRENTLYKAGYNLKSQTDIFMKNNIPSLYITSTDGYNPMLFFNKIPGLKQKNLTAQLFFFLISMSNNYQELELETNYLVMPLKNSYFFLKEKYNILIYLAFITILIIFSMKYSKNFFRYIRKMFKHFLVIIWLFLLCFLFLFLATLTTEFIILFKGSPNIWIETPATVFFIKIITAIVFLFSSLFLLQKISLPYSSSFYSSSAIFLMLINIFIFQFLNITLSFVAMWGLVWAIVFSFSENRWIKTGCLIISYYLIYDAVKYIFIAPAINLCNILISSKITGNVLIAITLLPGIMMILRILYIQTRIELKKYKILRRVIFSITLLTALTLTGYYYWFDIYKNKKMPVLFVYTIDTDMDTSIIEVSTPVESEDIKISIDSNNYSLETGNLKKIEITNNNTGELVEIQKTLSWFLDRKNIVLDIIPKGNPEKIEILFHMEENQIILDSNYQFTLQPNLRGGEFHIGYNPNFPLRLDILTNKEADILFEIKFIYRTQLFNMDIKGNNMIFYDYTVVRKSIYG